MKQEVTRLKNQKKEAVALDEVDYVARVYDKDIDGIKEINPEGVYITGLKFEGCKWAGGQIMDVDSKEQFPLCKLMHVTSQKKIPSMQENDKMLNQYKCPVYKYKRRTDRYIIFRIPLSCEGNAQKWKLRGVALLASTD